MESVLLIAPHPDDETLGAAVWMSRHGGPLTIVHATDGSPRDLRDATVAGFLTREAYAYARRVELREALSCVGIEAQTCVAFNFVDQELILHLEEFVAKLGALLARVRPEVVLTPAYEGGHPDHDTVALAAAMLRDPYRFRHREYRLYHSGPDGELDSREFLPPYSSQRGTFTDRERDLKRTMFRQFRSQTRVLAQFPIEDERFRDAPAYDFSRPPHPGPLLYERWGFRITGEQWRAQACAVHG